MLSMFKDSFKRRLMLSAHLAIYRTTCAEGAHVQVRAVAGIVEERLASHVKKELRDIVAPAITDAVRRVLQRRAANEHMLAQVSVMHILPQPAR